MRYILDTNTCIYIIKRSPPEVFARFKNLRIGDVGISAITFCELQFGVSKSSSREKNQTALNEFLAPIEVLDFPAEAAVHFGDVRAGLETKGTPIGNFDLLIAVHALHSGATLVTNNVREFTRVPGLKIENWIENGSKAKRH